jgi:hypothetical protein
LYYVGPANGSWSDGNNWSTTFQGAGGAGVPSNETAFVTGSNAAVSVNMDDTYASPGIAFLEVDGGYDGSNYVPATVNQSTGNLLVGGAGTIQVGQSGGGFYGVYNQSGGTVSTGALQIYNGSSYNLSGGTLTVTGSINIDAGAQFIATGGTYTAASTTGTGTINFNSNTGLTGGTIAAPVSVAADTTLTNTSGDLVFAGAQTWGANTTLEMDGGSATFQKPFGANTGTATLFVHANTTVVHINLAAGGVTAGNRITWAAGLTMNTPGEGVLDAGTGEVVGSNSLSIDVADGGSMDINDNTFILHDSDVDHNAAKFAQLAGWLGVGYNGGAWNGLGIKSSVAAATSGHALGILNNDDGTGNPIYTTFHNSPVDAHEILIQYTYSGDTDLSGVLNATDFNHWLAGFQGGGTTWAQGDFTYDGVVDIPNDFLALAEGWKAEYGSAGGLEPLVDGSDLSAPQKLQADALIETELPEPASAGLLGIGGLALLRRRSRK